MLLKYEVELILRCKFSGPEKKKNPIMSFRQTHTDCAISTNSGYVAAEEKPALAVEFWGLSGKLITAVLRETQNETNYKMLN